MKILIKSCVNCPFMCEILDDVKCNLQGKIIIDLNPEWCPLLIEDYNFSLNVENDSIDFDQMTEFNKSIENINSQLNTLQNSSEELNKLFNKFNGTE